MRAEKHQVTRVWHPGPELELLDLANGVNANVLVGEPAYQLTTGEVVGLGSNNFDYFGQALLAVDRQITLDNP